MSKEEAKLIVAMIYKELRRNDLTELCEEYGISVEKLDLFLSYALSAVSNLNNN